MSVSWSMMAAVAAGGAIGATGRFWVGHSLVKLLGPGFPWGTLTVNVVGSFLMGCLVQAVALKFDLSRDMSAFLTVGVLGGFTTFSTFSLDTMLMLQRGQMMLAGGYVTASVLLGVTALFAGLALAKVVWG